MEENRLTREKDKWECRIIDCPAEEWFNEIIGGEIVENICESCPWEKYINKLAEYEDAEAAARTDKLDFRTH